MPACLLHSTQAKYVRQTARTPFLMLHTCQEDTLLGDFFDCAGTS